MSSFAVSNLASMELMTRSSRARVVGRESSKIWVMVEEKKERKKEREKGRKGERKRKNRSSNRGPEATTLSGHRSCHLSKVRNLWRVATRAAEVYLSCPLLHQVCTTVCLG